MQTANEMFATVVADVVIAALVGCALVLLFVATARYVRKGRVRRGR